MRRGTTPDIIITTQIDLTTTEVLYLTIAQAGINIIEKEKTEVTVTDKTVEVIFSQADTLSLNAKLPFEMQIRARYPASVEYPEGKAVESNIMIGDVGRALKEGVI